MIKRGKHFWEIEDDVYHARIFLFAGCSSKEVDAYILKRFPNCEDRNAMNINWAGYGGQIYTKDRSETLAYLVYIKDGAWCANLIYTLIHETFHVVHRIMVDRGIHADAGEGEHYAYYLEWLFRRFYQFLAETRPPENSST